MSEKILGELIEFLCRSFLVEEDEIDLDESLVDQGIIDSFGLVEISTFITKRYGVTVEDDDMNRANFGSAKRITKYIEDRART